MDAMNDFKIDYDSLLREVAGLEDEELITELVKILIECWIDDYWAMVDHRPYVLDVPDRGFNFLFDLTLANHYKNDPDRPDDRVVAAYGRSRKMAEKRDASRIRGFGAIGDKSRGSMDKGHFAAHSMGGALDINIFPQRSEVNRGRSAEGGCIERWNAMLPSIPGPSSFRGRSMATPPGHRTRWSTGSS
jgi:hypothetical protein